MSEYIDRESAVNIPVKPEEYRSYKAYDFVQGLCRMDGMMLLNV